MFEHLDDPSSGRTGTSAHLAATRNRAREISRQHRRNRLAVGSVTVAASASVTGVALLAAPGGLGSAAGEVGAGGSRATAPTTSGKESPGTQLGASAKSVPAKSVPAGDRATKDACAASSGPAATTPPPGYRSTADTSVKPEGQHYARTDGQDATVWVKVTCSGIAADDRTSTASKTYTAEQVAGRAGWSWHAGSDEAGVEWTAADGTSVYIKAVGAAGVRLSDAALEAYAASLPAT